MAWSSPTEHMWTAPRNPRVGCVISDRYILCSGEPGGVGGMPPDGWVVVDTILGTSEPYDGAVVSPSSPSTPVYMESYDGSGWMSNGIVLQRLNLNGTINSYLIPSRTTVDGYTMLAVFSNKIWLFNHIDATSQTTTDVKIFDPSTETWSVGADPIPKVAFAGGYGGFLHVSAGVFPSYLHKVDASGAIVSSISTSFIGATTSNVIATANGLIMAMGSNVYVMRYDGTNVKLLMGSGTKSRIDMIGSVLVAGSAGRVYANTLGATGAASELVRPTTRSYGSPVFIVGGRLWAPSGDPA